MSGVECVGASRAAEAAGRCIQEGGCCPVAEREKAWEGGISYREGQGRKEAVVSSLSGSEDTQVKVDWRRLQLRHSDLR